VGWQSFGSTLGYQRPLFDCPFCLTTVSGDKYPLFREGDCVAYPADPRIGWGEVVAARVGYVKARFATGGGWSTWREGTPDQFEFIRHEEPIEDVLAAFGVPPLKAEESHE